MLLSHPASKDVDMQGWKIITGGSALPVGLATAAEERGIDIFCGYGMSETGPLSTIAHLAPSGERNAQRAIATRLTAGTPATPGDVASGEGWVQDGPPGG